MEPELKVKSRMFCYRLSIDLVIVLGLFVVPVLVQCPGLSEREVDSYC
ncbi:hypothetical protein CK203_024110 [Vitis vinifera]|uniref:Uncharacterized protein n=1 Tax=Vitis vinifera TaxID=29760 RepID=A0A438FAN9_VITVI|nr:hypothetical protein CK203_070515 [Vitis vinifera]RVW98747.1 hypothetical protein CK203_024110 [Vitis vinifera]